LLASLLLLPVPALADAVAGFPNCAGVSAVVAIPSVPGVPPVPKASLLLLGTVAVICSTGVPAIADVLIGVDILIPCVLTVPAFINNIAGVPSVAGIPAFW
jgi:hypothetical protein